MRRKDRYDIADLDENQYEPMTKLFIAVIERTLQIHGK